MSAEERAYTPEEIEILRKAFDILVRMNNAANETEREDIARALLFEARRGVATVDAMVKRMERTPR